jgi:hypothetical protein
VIVVDASHALAAVASSGTPNWILPKLKRRVSQKTDFSFSGVGYALALVLALGATPTWGAVKYSDRPVSRKASSHGKDGPPAWVVKHCRPASGIEILGWFAGPGDWFYRSLGKFCYFDPRPILP